MKALRIIKHVISYLVLLLLLAGGGYVAASRLGYAPAIHPFVVMSGSMEPAIPVGSVVISQPSDTYAVGDVITFESGKGKTDTTTHRIAEVQPLTDEVSYVTKGDANAQTDAKTVEKSKVVGKVMLSAPYVGYVVSFAKEPYGFIAMVIIPATIVVYEELKTLWTELIKGIRRLTKKGDTTVEIDVVAKMETSAAVSELEPELVKSKQIVAPDVPPVSDDEPRHAPAPYSLAADDLSAAYADLAPMSPMTAATNNSPVLKLAPTELPVQPSRSKVTESVQPQAPRQVVRERRSPARLWLPLVPVLGSLTVFVLTTGSFFSDVEASIGSVLSAADSFVQAEPAISPLSNAAIDATPSATPTQEPIATESATASPSAGIPL